MPSTRARKATLTAGLALVALPATAITAQAVHWPNLGENTGLYTSGGVSGGQRKLAADALSIRRGPSPPAAPPGSHLRLTGRSS